MSFRATNWGPQSHAFRPSGPRRSETPFHPTKETSSATPAAAAASEREPQPEALDPEAPEVPSAPEPQLDPEPVDLEALRTELWAEARAEAQAEVAAERAALEQAREELEHAAHLVSGLKAEALAEGAQDMATVVLAVTERVLTQSLALHPDALKTLIRRTMEQLPEAEEVVVHVSPGTLAVVNNLSDPRCRLVADDTVEAGCVLRSAHVSVDATVEATLRGVDEAVRAWLAEQPWVTEWMLAEVDR